MSDFIDLQKDTIPDTYPDVCIIGLGAAGSVLASELANKGQRVMVLEAGSMDIDASTQNLYSMEQKGVPYYDMTSCRLRYVGGTTNHWGGYCHPNEPIDYEGREDLDVPAWPFDYKHITPYVNKAANLLGLSEKGFSVYEQISRNNFDKSVLIEEHSDLLTTKVAQITKEPRYFKLNLVPKLLKHDNVDICINANVTHLQLDSDGTTVSEVVVKSLNGNSVRVKSKRFVLASHAVENSRLLLVSNDVAKNGIGNDSDHVGRYFMEHPHIHSGVMYPTSHFSEFYASDKMRRIKLNANLALSKKALIDNGILQYYCRFNPVYSRSDTAKSLNKLRSSFWKPADIDSLKALANIVSDVPDSVRYTKSQLNRGKPLFYRLEHRIEQSPNKLSRIILAEEKDRLGMRKAILNWELSDLDIRTFQKGQEIVAQELALLGMGKFELPTITRQMAEADVTGHYHHIGTTRMSNLPSDGVVDKNCKVHGVNNLYVAGSSVFPTTGFSGPTMMIIAMSIRLAEYISDYD